MKHDDRALLAQGETPNQSRLLVAWRGHFESIFDLFTLRALKGTSGA
jgi:hypothetical protein